MTIEALPDNVLLDIFEFSLYMTWGLRWSRLVHVCQRWRYLVFASPLRLNLQLFYTSKRPVKEMLDVWPPLPIYLYVDPDNVDSDNMIAALEHRDRVRNILIINLTSSQLERLAAMMQEPFLALTMLQLETRETVRALPDMFLGVSAPRLESLFLVNIPFPGLPRLLLSATDLSQLSLLKIPDTGYISPEAMVTGLSTLTRLGYLCIEFMSPASCPYQRCQRPPPITRFVLPALTYMTFRGDNEYLEDFIARIDAPRLNGLNIAFFNHRLDVSQLLQFITHAGMTKSYNRATVVFKGAYVRFAHRPPEGTTTPGRLILEILVSCMTQICSQYSSLLPSVEKLDIYLDASRWQVDSDPPQWLELFRPFTGVRTLRISCHSKSPIMCTLQDLDGEMAIEVLPALDDLYLEDYQPSGPEQKVIEPFIAARQYSDHPVSVHRWERPIPEGSSGYDL